MLSSRAQEERKNVAQSAESKHNNFFIRTFFLGFVTILYHIKNEKAIKKTCTQASLL
jgi:hypothetical protein